MEPSPRKSINTYFIQKYRRFYNKLKLEYPHLNDDQLVDLIIKVIDKLTKKGEYKPRNYKPKK